MAIVFSNDTHSKVFETFAVRDNEPATYISRDMPANWLKDNNGLKHFFEEYGAYINAPSYDMAATFWANRYSRFIAFFHWSLARGCSVLPFLSDLQLYLTKRCDRNEPSFEFCVIYGDTIDRSMDNREKLLAEYYSEHVTPLFMNASSISNLRPRELWGQLYHAVPYYLNLAKMSETETVQHKINKDWQFITEEADPELFQAEKSPFRFKTIPIPNPVDDNPLYTKPTCCLSYKGNGKYCYRCPRMKPDVREEYLKKQK